MRKLCLLALLVCPWASAQVVQVQSHSLIRLPSTTGTLTLERLDVADYGTLLVPSNVTQLSIGELHLGRDARIAIVPAQQALHMTVAQAEMADGSQITSRGAPGTYTRAARPGRDLDLRFDALNAPALSVDARGGAGAPGFVGLDGANGQAPGCTWGSAGRGADGSNGSDGLPGAGGAQVRLELPRDYPDEQIRVAVEGGAGGAPGPGGKPGAGGTAKGCLVYTADGGKSGRPGTDGQPGPTGAAGKVTVQRF